MYPGPTANLKAINRRSGRAGTVWINGRMHGEVTAVEWGEEAEQIPVALPGKWRDGIKPGAEAGRGTFRYHDIDDRWRLLVWRFFKARRDRDRSAAAFPLFDIVTKIDDIGAPRASVWVLKDCQFFQYDGGHSQDDNLLVRDVPFVFEQADPLDAFEYGENGVLVTRA